MNVASLGRVEYADGLQLMESLWRGRQDGSIPDTLVLLEHNPVITVGRSGSEDNILATRSHLEAQGVEVHAAGRGGDVTLHAPGQIVGYPIFDLRDGRKDVRRYIRDLEAVMIATLADFKITAERAENLTGVWVGRNKVAAIGVRISRWVTSHGFAFNYDNNLALYDFIIPCGIRDRGVTSMRKLLGNALPTQEEVRARLASHFSSTFGRTMASRDIDLETVSVTIARPGRSGGLEFLALRRVPSRGGFWQQVTGRKEPGESPSETAKRECREETGLDVHPIPLNYEHDFCLEREGKPLRFVRERAFCAMAPAGFEPTRQAQEHDAHEWLSLEEARTRITLPGLQRALGLSRPFLQTPQ